MLRVINLLEMRFTTEILQKWQRFGNTLLLRVAMRLSRLILLLQNGCSNSSWQNHGKNTDDGILSHDPNGGRPPLTV